MSEITQLRDARVVAVTDACAAMLGTLDNASEMLAAGTMDKDEYVRVTLQAHARLTARWEQAWAAERAASATAAAIRAAGDPVAYNREVHLGLRPDPDDEHVIDDDPCFPVCSNPGVHAEGGHDV